jgi:hypothetical protein
MMALRPAQYLFVITWDVTISGEGLQNLGLRSALSAFELGEIGTLFFGLI